MPDLLGIDRHPAAGELTPTAPWRQALRHVGLFDAAVGVVGEAALVGGVHGTVDGPRPAAEAGALVVDERLAQLGLVVHHERALLGDRLADRPALQHQALGARSDEATATGSSHRSTAPVSLPSS